MTDLSQLTFTAISPERNSTGSRAPSSPLSWISVKDWIDVFHDISAHIEEVALILDRYERTLCAIVFRDLKRLCEDRRGLMFP